MDDKVKKKKSEKRKATMALQLSAAGNVLALTGGSHGFCSSRKSSHIIQASAKSAVGIAESAGDGGASTASSEVAKTAGSGNDVQTKGCRACGRPLADMERGCNGEGRIQGGIGAFPGFQWWPIKAYRPCPAFVRSGGRYRRSGQSLDEIAFGRKGAGDDLDVSERLGKNS